MVPGFPSPPGIRAQFALLSRAAALPLAAFITFEYHEDEDVSAHTQLVGHSGLELARSGEELQTRASTKRRP
jgi:hypothetical protein